MKTYTAGKNKHNNVTTNFIVFRHAICCSCIHIFHFSNNVYSQIHKSQTNRQLHTQQSLTPILVSLKLKYKTMHDLIICFALATNLIINYKFCCSTGYLHPHYVSFALLELIDRLLSHLRIDTRRNYILWQFECAQVTESLNLFEA